MSKWAATLGRSFAVLAVVAGAAWFAVELRPSIEPRQDLPDDVASLTASTWKSFEAAFPGQAGCLRDVELELVEDIPAGSAEYVEEERLIRIEIPTSPRRYVESLTHELAHHLDEVCDVERVIGGAFRTAQGIGADVPWDRTDTWEQRPMEQFAETVVEYVTGDRYTHADIIDVSEAAVEIVEAWATGSS